MAVEDESDAKSSAHVKEDARYRSPSQLTTVTEVLSTLSAIQSREATISAALSDLLSSRKPVNNSLRRLNSLSSDLQELQSDTNIFFQKVSATAETAQRIGECVRDLDEEMKRVKESVDMVGQVQELKSSLQMLQSAMDSKEYDAATRHCARAMSIPSAVLSSQFSEAVVVSSIRWSCTARIPSQDHDSPQHNRLCLQQKRFRMREKVCCWFFRRNSRELLELEMPP
jgi:uncharacterized protein YoxC